MWGGGRRREIYRRESGAAVRSSVSHVRRDIGALYSCCRGNDCLWRAENALWWAGGGNRRKRKKCIYVCVRKKCSHIRIRTMVSAFGPFGIRSSSFVSTEIGESAVLLCAWVCSPDGDDGRFELCNSFMFSECFFRRLFFSFFSFPPSPHQKSAFSPTSELIASGKLRVYATTAMLRPRPPVHTTAVAVHAYNAVYGSRLKRSEPKRPVQMPRDIVTCLCRVRRSIGARIGSTML